MYLNIDIKKILADKAPKIDPLTESFNFLKSNQTPTNIINFISSYKSSPKEIIIENLSSLCDINSDITFSYVNNVLEVADLSDDILNKYKSHISSLLESSNDIDYSNRLEETISIIDSNIRNNNDMELIKEEVLTNLAIDRIKKSCIFESYLEDDLEVLIYNINSSPETISEYEQIVRKIKVSKTSEYFSSYPMLLVKNTDLIRNMTIRVTGDVLDLLTSMPIVIANKLVDAKLSDTVIKSYIKIFDKQIAIMYMELKSNEPSQYQLYSTYVKKLIDAKRIISEKGKKEKTTESALKENIAEMQPDVIIYDEGVVEDLIAEMEDSLADIIFDPNDELDNSKLENFTRLCRTYEAVSRVQRTAIKASHSSSKVIQKGVNKIKDVQSNSKRVMIPVKKSLDPLINMFNSTINKIKEMDKKERTERIITGEFRLKLIGFIKKAIIGLGSLKLGAATSKTIAKGAVGVVASPAKLGGLVVIAIAILVGVAIDKKIDAKHRRRILNDLKAELEIVNEKIEDAKSDNDKKAKYELMRIRNKLTKDIERIEYHLD